VGTLPKSSERVAVHDTPRVTIPTLLSQDEFQNTNQERQDFEVGGPKRLGGSGIDRLIVEDRISETEARYANSDPRDCKPPTAVR